MSRAVVLRLWAVATELSRGLIQTWMAGLPDFLIHGGKARPKTVFFRQSAQVMLVQLV